MKRNLIFLIIGLILFALGGYQNIQYEEHSLLVDATVTDIKSKDDPDGGYTHVYYGSYTVDGTEYTDQKLTTKYTNTMMPEDLFVGDTVELRVYPEKPGKKVAEGGIFITVGVVMTVYNAIVLHKHRKRAKAQAKAE